MTSDRGTSGQAEMQLSNLPVTPKTPGLNPNANEFHSKGVITPPDSSSEWSPEATFAGKPISASTDGSLHMNGDVEGKTQGTITFPPTPDSPQTEYTSVNGNMDCPGPVQSLYSDPSSPSDDSGPLDGTLPEEQLRAMLKTQLEYYFSRENLVSDSYLVSQMDADQYVPIATVAGFNQVKRLTSNLELVVEVLRDSPDVQVDQAGEKVRPLHKRCIVILREIPDSTPIEEVKALFYGENCPKFSSCEFAHNNSWYVSFESEEDAQRAYRFLREEKRTFHDKPIMARIKAKPLLRSAAPFVPKNGVKSSTQFDPNAAVYNPVPNNPPKYSAYSQPTVANVQYIQPSQQVQNFPFFPPSTGMAAAATAPVWTQSNNAQLTYFTDPGTAFAANGYTAAAAYKVSNSNSSRGFPNMRNRTPKSHRGPQPSPRENVVERDRQSHERHSHGMSRASPRNDSILGTAPKQQDTRSHVNHNTTSHSAGHGGPATNGSASSSSDRHSVDKYENKDQGQPRLERSSEIRRGIGGSGSSGVGGGGPSYRSRRRRPGDEDGAKRTSVSGNVAPKEVKQTSAVIPKFELEATSFPPLPGSTNTTTTNDVFENKMSDVVKGTAKPLTRECKAPVAVAAQGVPFVSNVSTGIKDDNYCSSVTFSQSSSSSQVPKPIVASTKSDTPINDKKQSIASAPKLAVTSTLVQPGSNSLPTPPLSPNAKTNADAIGASGGQEKDSVSTPSQSSNAQSKQQDVSGLAKLSYAQMAQRGKERVEREVSDPVKVKDGASAGEGDKEQNGDNSTQASGASSGTGALREQQASSVRSPTREPREEPKDQRPARRLKENRDSRSDGRTYREYSHNDRYHRGGYRDAYRNNDGYRGDRYRNEGYGYRDGGYRGSYHNDRDGYRAERRDRDSERPRLGK